MAERPEPFQDLNWEPARARAFGDRVLDLWEEFLAKLPELPVTSRGFTEKAVHDGVVIPVPDGPMTEDDLVDHIRTVWFDYSMTNGLKTAFRYEWMGTWATGFVIAGATTLWRALFHWFGSNEGDAPEVFFITGTRSIPQIGHLPGASACTDGCMVQV